MFSWNSRSFVAMLWFLSKMSFGNRNMHKPLRRKTNKCALRLQFHPPPTPTLRLVVLTPLENGEVWKLQADPGNSVRVRVCLNMKGCLLLI